MDNQNLLDDLSSDQLAFTPASISYLKETAKWARFLAIVGFIFVGFMVLGSFTAGTILSSSFAGVPGGSPIAGGAVTFIYLLFSLLYFIPTLYLYRFSKNARLAIDSNDTDLMTEALGNMKSVYKFWGIAMAILLGFYALIFLVAIFAGGMATMLN
ncbi:MAG: hypothetical protein AAFP19_08570 [Bacteroidota bacterium]